MEFKSDLELLNDFVLIRNLKEITKKSYKTSLNLYTDFNNKQFLDLISEAELEETKKIRWKNRKLKQRLLTFRNFLTANYRKNYAKTTFSRIVTLYRHYDIEVHHLPAQSSKNFNESPPITYGDLPNKSVIKKALRKSDSQMKAIILFMASSGCARRETLNLTVNDFINATADYHNSTEIEEVLKTLKNKRKVIPTFKIKRQKTNKYYFTFCTPEATKAIIRHLSERNNLKSSSKIFPIHPESLSRKFIKINNELKLGKSGTYNRFRSHNLRKFHASKLKNDGMLIEDINSMQGKSRNITDEAYFFENPEILKKKYLSHINAVIIYDKNKIRPNNSAKVMFQKSENT